MDAPLASRVESFCYNSAVRRSDSRATDTDEPILKSEAVKRERGAHKSTLESEQSGAIAAERQEQETGAPIWN
jgi:hypothetical protein